MNRFLLIILTLLCLITPGLSKAQKLTAVQVKDSTAIMKTYQLLEEMPDDIQTTLLKVRKLMLKYMDENNTDGMIHLLKFSTEEFKEDQGNAFSYLERLLFYYRTGEYKQALDYLRQLRSTNVFQLQSAPGNDGLTIELITYFINFNESYQAAIERSELTEEEMQVLIISLEFSLSEFDDNITQEKINDACNHFLTQYPGSTWTDIIKMYRYELERGPWNGGCSIGGGYIQTKGDLHEIIDQAGGFNFSFDLYYKQWYWAFAAGVYFRKVQQDLPYKHGVWEKGSKASMSRFEANAGYNILEYKRHTLTPFVLLGGTNYKPDHNKDDDNYKQLKHAGLDLCFNYGVGIQYDLRFAEKTRNDLFTPSIYQNGIRIRYTLSNPQFRPKYNARGQIHQITLGYFFKVQSLARKR